MISIIKKRTKSIFQIFEMHCGKIQGQFVISFFKTEITVVSDLMSMLTYTVIVENASLCTVMRFRLEL